MLKQLSHGDLARLFQMNRSNASVKSEVARLSQELASGRKSSLAEAVRGDFAPVTGIEMTLSRNAAYATAGREAANFASVIQNALGTIATLGDGSAEALLTASQAAQPDLVATAAADAAARLAPALSALNAQFGGRSVFAGEAVDGPAMADAASFMAALTAATAGASDAASLVASVEAWFAPGGGYDSAAYLGAAAPLAPVAIGQGVSADLGITASDTRLRDTLKGLALARLVADGALAGDPDGRSALLGAAGEMMLQANSSLTQLRAQVGEVEELIEQTGVARDAETSALKIARAALVEIDPYETATRLTAAEAQLETLYAITARMQSLSLTNYLR